MKRMVHDRQVSNIQKVAPSPNPSDGDQHKPVSRL